MNEWTSALKPCSLSLIVILWLILCNFSTNTINSGLVISCDFRWFVSFVSVHILSTLFWSGLSLCLWYTSTIYLVSCLCLKISIFLFVICRSQVPDLLRSVSIGNFWLFRQAYVTHFQFSYSFLLWVWCLICDVSIPDMLFSLVHFSYRYYLTAP